MKFQHLIALIAAATILTGCRKTETRTLAATEPPPVAVAVLDVQPKSFTAGIGVTGTLVSRTLVDVKAETTGRLLKFPKQEGDRVAAGEVVAWVDPQNYELALRQARSAVQVAEAALERVRVVESHSRAELERARNLVKSGGITDRDLKAAELAERDAAAQTAVAAAQLDQARVAVDTAEKHLRDTNIKVLVAGEIYKKHVNPGAYVEPATPVLMLVDNQRLELESPVPAADLGLVRPGQKVTFAVNSYPGVAFSGRVVEVNPALEAQNRSATARIAVENPGGRLKAGMFAQGEILTGMEANAILVPSSAVYRDDRSAKSGYVFVVENGKAARRNVTIAQEREQTLHIASGLKQGDVVAAEQSIEIADGVRVTPRKQAVNVP